MKTRAFTIRPSHVSHGGLVTLSLALGCIAPAPPPAPALYDQQTQALAPAERARLETSLPGGASLDGGAPLIRTVNGRLVAHLGTSFELPPGCHVIETESHLVVATQGVAFRGDIGSRQFALPMRAGHAYVIALELSPALGGTASVQVTAREYAADGSETQRFEELPSVESARARCSALPSMVAAQASSTAPALADKIE